MAVFVSPDTIAAPTRITINGMAEADDLATKSTGNVVIGYDIIATLRTGYFRKARGVFVYSTDNFVTTTTYKAAWVGGDVFDPPDHRFYFNFGPLAQNTKYRVRAYTETGGPDFVSSKFNAFEFWTNRPPNIPTLTGPADNTTFVPAAPVPFDWDFSDPDPGESQSQYQVRWREVVEDTNPGEWIGRGGGVATNRSEPGTSFQTNRYYEWQVAVADTAGSWSPWSLTRSFYIQGGTSPPRLISPAFDTAIDVTAPVVFTWEFRDPESGDTQAKADLEYRAVGTADWTIVAGASSDATQSFTMDADVLIPNVHYEWRVQTYDVGSGGALASDWAEARTFYAINAPGRLAVDPIVVPLDIQGELGCGHNRVYVYQQGGDVRVGEITSIQQVIWKRQRDDISNCVVDTAGWDWDCGDLLSRLRSWQHELVVYRDGVRVWEGPITRITYTDTNVEVEAKDVMGYVYRRIMRQGYDDSYNCTQSDAQGNCIGLQLGLNTVVYRAARIIIDALGRGDPNVLPYLTPINNAEDARTSRIVPDYAKTAWEEVDDLAATAGLDYVTVGRRIILFDTHYPIGRLPEMRDGDFSDPVIVTEYGMNLCNYYGVTDGSGIWGIAYPDGHDQNNYDEFYGPIELLSSSYGDSSDDQNDASTPVAVEALRAKYASQAKRNIGNRWPTSVIVRVPDNTTIVPEVNLHINHLVPGVWVPLRSVATLREISQWQKIDTVTVAEGSGGEKIQIVMSPAPHGGADDPDAGTTGPTEGSS